MAASSCQTLPSYKVSIRRTKVLPPASFKPHLTMDPLPLAVCLLWSYRTRDFHPLDYTHAGRTPLSGCAGLLHGKACHTILRSLCSLTNRVPLPPLCRGQNKTPRNTLFINGSTVSTGYSATVEVLHRTSKWGEVRRLACPLRRFPFAAPPNCGGGKGTGFIGEL